MNVLIKKATVISASSPFHLQVKDILVTDGIIKEIGPSINNSNAEIVSGKDLHVSIGWMDIFADFGEPGFDHRETLESGSAAAAAGGFTDVMIIPNTLPALSSKAQVEFITQRSQNLPVNIHPIGAVTKNAEGKELAEMYDMYSGGAVAFSDGTKSIQQPGMLLKGLQYLSAKNAVLIQLPEETSISSGGLMNEGIMSTQLGLPGNPSIAEELMIARDIALLDYTGSALHITGVSTEKGLALIRKAKKQGLRITCSVTPYHLFFCDEALSGYDTNFKVSPPLRTHRDMEAMREGLISGDIDCIASHHSPQCWDDKICEFEYAANGMITLQNVYGTLNALNSDTEANIKMLTENPREIFSVEMPEIRVSAPACLTLFEPNTSFVFEEAMILSKSKNSAFVGKEMKGKLIGIINKNKKLLFS